MPRLDPGSGQRLLAKTCLACGYAGPSLQGRTGRRLVRCPNCGADLYARPPRSYAELEGFLPVVDEPIDPSEAIAPRRRPRKWLKLRGLLLRAFVAALLITPPLVAIAAAGALAAIWMLRN